MGNTLAIRLLKVITASEVKNVGRGKCNSRGTASLSVKPERFFSLSAFVPIPYQNDTTEPAFSTIDDDPPLSPITLPFWAEADCEYQNVHMEPLIAEVTDSQPELDISYRPQPVLLSCGEEATETEEEEDDVWDEAAMATEDVMGLLPGSFLFSVEVDFSDMPLELIPGRCPFWPQSLGISNGDRPVETSSTVVDLPRGETVFHQNTVEARLADGYLPQVAGVDTQC